MNCYCCNTSLAPGTARFAVYGRRTVCVHISCQRDALIARTVELGWQPDAALTNQQLIDSIVAEQLADEWVEHYNKLPSDEARREAAHKLRLMFEAR